MIDGSTERSRRRRLGMLAALTVLALGGGVAIVLSSRRPAPASPSATPREQGPRPLVRVGGTVLTEADVVRYQTLHELMLGAVSARQALDALVERTILVKEAEARGVALDDGEVQQLVLRRKLMIGAGVDSPTPALGAAPPVPGAPPGAEPSPLARADRRLAEAGIPDALFREELRAEALATRLRRSLEAEGDVGAALAGLRGKYEVTDLR